MKQLTISEIQELLNEPGRSRWFKLSNQERKNYLKDLKDFEKKERTTESKVDFMKQTGRRTYQFETAKEYEDYINGEEFKNLSLEERKNIVEEYQSLPQQFFKEQNDSLSEALKRFKESQPSVEKDFVTKQLESLSPEERAEFEKLPVDTQEKILGTVKVDEPVTITGEQETLNKINPSTPEQTGDGEEK